MQLSRQQCDQEKDSTTILSVLKQMHSLIDYSSLLKENSTVSWGYLEIMCGAQIQDKNSILNQPRIYCVSDDLSTDAYRAEMNIYMYIYIF